MEGAARSTQPEQKRKEKSDKKYHRSLSKKRLKNKLDHDHDVKKKEKKMGVGESVSA